MYCTRKARVRLVRLPSRTYNLPACRRPARAAKPRRLSQRGVHARQLPSRLSRGSRPHPSVPDGKVSAAARAAAGARTDRARRCDAADRSAARDARARARCGLSDEAGGRNAVRGRGAAAGTAVVAAAVAPLAARDLRYLSCGRGRPRGRHRRQSCRRHPSRVSGSRRGILRAQRRRGDDRGAARRTARDALPDRRPGRAPGQRHGRDLWPRSRRLHAVAARCPQLSGAQGGVDSRRAAGGWPRRYGLSCAAG